MHDRPHVHPAPSRRRRAAGVALGLVGAALLTATPAASAAAAPGVVLHWKGTLQSPAPEAPGLLIEEWAYLSGTGHRVYTRTQNLRNPEASIETWSSDEFGGYAKGRFDTPLKERVKAGDWDCSGSFDPRGREFEADLLASRQHADALRGDAAAFGALPAGPTVNGRPTKLAQFDEWADNVDTQHDPAFEVAYDAQTGAVVRTGLAGSDVAQYPTVWELLPASKAALTEPPAEALAACGRVAKRTTGPKGSKPGKRTKPSKRGSRRTKATSAKSKASARAKGAAPKKTGGKKGRRANADGLLVHLTGVKTTGGDLGRGTSEAWLAFTADGRKLMRTRFHADDAQQSHEGWDTVRISAAVDGPLSQPLADRWRSTGEAHCLDRQRYFPGDGYRADFNRAERATWEHVLAMTTDDAARATLPAGPELSGRPTVRVTAPPAVAHYEIDGWANTTLLDRETGEPVGASHASQPWSFVYTSWSATPADEATIDAVVGPPEQARAACR